MSAEPAPQSGCPRRAGPAPDRELMPVPDAHGSRSGRCLESARARRARHGHRGERIPACFVHLGCGETILSAPSSSARPKAQRAPLNPATRYPANNFRTLVSQLAKQSEGVYGNWTTAEECRVWRGPRGFQTWKSEFDTDIRTKYSVLRTSTRNTPLISSRMPALFTRVTVVVGVDECEDHLGMKVMVPMPNSLVNEAGSRSRVLPTTYHVPWF